MRCSTSRARTSCGRSAASSRFRSRTSQASRPIPIRSASRWHGIKLIGTDVPGLFAAGTFYYHGEVVFWDVRDIAHTVIVSLEHERYKKLIIEVSDVAATVERLRAALPTDDR